MYNIYVCIHTINKFLLFYKIPSIIINYNQIHISELVIDYKKKIPQQNRIHNIKSTTFLHIIFYNFSPAIFLLMVNFSQWLFCNKVTIVIHNT